MDKPQSCSPWRWLTNNEFVRYTRAREVQLTDTERELLIRLERATIESPSTIGFDRGSDS